MSVCALAYAIDLIGVTPEEKLIFMLMADSMDVDGCFPVSGFDRLAGIACMSRANFDAALARLIVREGAYYATDALDGPAIHFPHLNESGRRVRALEVVA